MMCSASTQLRSGERQPATVYNRPAGQASLGGDRAAGAHSSQPDRRYPSPSTTITLQKWQLVRREIDTARCPKIPARRFRHSWPVCCLTLSVAVREGFRSAILDLRGLQRAADG
jgi:hypothetical protein